MIKHCLPKGLPPWYNSARRLLYIDLKRGAPIFKGAFYGATDSAGRMKRDKQIDYYDDKLQRETEQLVGDTPV